MLIEQAHENHYYKKVRRTDTKKIEIIARITDEGGATMEQSLMTWQDRNYQWNGYSLTLHTLC